MIEVILKANASLLIPFNLLIKGMSKDYVNLFETFLDPLRPFIIMGYHLADPPPS